MIENTYPIESGAFLDKPIKDYKSSSFKTRKIYFSNVRKNKLKYNYPNNFVKTSKYTFYDFFPKALLFQFFRYANCYFLLIAIVQIFPAVSPLSPVTAIVPLVIVLLISIIREGIEDYYRHVSDEKENMEVVQKYNGRTFSQELSKNLEVGDIIKVDEYDIVPADIILISCKNLSKIAYVETANLDGEKNLKPKFCVPQLFNIFKDIDIISRMKGEMKCDIPNSKLSEFNGRVKLSKTNDYSVNVKQLLHKGTILKNTPWAIGLVVYSGKDTKIILNSQKSQSKSSHLEMNVNILILFIFGFQIILCIILAIICSLWTSNNLNYISNCILPIIPSDTAGFYSFWSYLLLLNTMIPISLIVSIEIVKYAQGYFMNNDIEMYSVVKDK